MSKVKDLHRSWSDSASYRAAYNALDGEFALARVLIATRARAGLSQAELAVRMRTSQSYIARIEGGTVCPSTAVLERLAAATGTRLQIRFVSQRGARPHSTRSRDASVRRATQHDSTPRRRTAKDAR